MNNLSNLLQIIKGRRSIRQYQEKPVPLEKIKEMIKSALWAPSSCNRQPLFFVIVTDLQLKRYLSSVLGQKHTAKAPVVIVVTIDLSRYGTLSKNDISLYIDAGVAIQNMLLTAHTFGLGCCLIAGRIDEVSIRKVLDLPKDYKVAALLTVGWPKDYPPAPVRKHIRDSYSANKFLQNSGVTPYKKMVFQKQLISRAGWNVTETYNRPQEGIDLFTYTKDRIFEMIKNKGKILFTNTCLGHLVDLGKTNIDYLAGSQDEAWYIKKFINTDTEIVIGNATNLSNVSGEYDCIISPFDLNFMNNNEIEIFVLNSKSILKKDGEIIVIYFNENSFYGLNYKLAKVLKKGLESERNGMLEKPIQSSYIKSHFDNKFSKVWIRTGMFIPPINIAYLSPITIIIPAKLCKKFDFLKNIFKDSGNIAFLIASG